MERFLWYHAECAALTFFCVIGLGVLDVYR
jgi:hypothetical protein